MTIQSLPNWITGITGFGGWVKHQLSLLFSISIYLDYFFTAISFFLPLPPFPSFDKCYACLPTFVFLDTVCPELLFLAMLYLVTEDDWFHVGHSWNIYDLKRFFFG